MDKIETLRRWKQWWDDPVRAELFSEIQDRQVAVFLNAATSVEDREAAHQVVCAIKQLDQQIRRLERRADET